MDYGSDTLQPFYQKVSGWTVHLEGPPDEWKNEL